MSHSDEIVRQRQSAIRRELDRRGIALKAVSFDSGIGYSTLLTYFPQEGAAKAVMLPVSALYALTDGENPAIPLDLASLLLPPRRLIVNTPESVDHDAFEDMCREFLATKGAAHHPESPAGRELAQCEIEALDSKVVQITAVAA